MNDVEKLMNNIGARVHYQQFHESTTEGHTQVPRRAAPLKETEPEEDRSRTLYDPEGAQYEAHPLDADAIAHHPQPVTAPRERRSWDDKIWGDEIWGEPAPSGFRRYAPRPEAARAADLRSLPLSDVFARLERVGRRDAGRSQ